MDPLGKCAKAPAAEIESAIEPTYEAAEPCLAGCHIAFVYILTVWCITECAT